MDSMENNYCCRSSTPSILETDMSADWVFAVLVNQRTNQICYCFFRFRKEQQQEEEDTADATTVTTVSHRSK